MINIITYRDCEYEDDQSINKIPYYKDVKGVEIGRNSAKPFLDWDAQMGVLGGLLRTEVMTITNTNAFSKQDIHHYVNITVYKTAMVFLHDKIIDVKEQEKALGGGL